MSSNFPPDIGSQPPSPGEIPRAGTSQSLLMVGACLIALVAALMFSPLTEDLRAHAKTILAAMTQSNSPPAPSVAPPVARRANPPAGAAAPHDDLARPLAFYFARWGVIETPFMNGLTSRVEIREGAGGGATARVWISCPKGICEAGVFAVKPIAHLEKKDQTAYLLIERGEGDKVWTLLLRPATGRPNELERWEWLGPPDASDRTQGVRGYVHRVRPDGSLY